MNCVLAIKSYAEGKLGGRSGSFKFGPKPPISGKPILRKNSEPFMKSLWSMSLLCDKDGYMSGNPSYNDPGHDRPEGVRESFMFIIFFFFA